MTETGHVSVVFALQKMEAKRVRIIIVMQIR